MNSLWQQMLTLLAEIKPNDVFAALRTEFEAEGARSAEVASLARLATSSGFDLDLKIGGAEAVRDLQEAAELGVARIIAPMIETPYALQKFVTAAKRVYQDNLQQIKLLINIETITGCQNFAAMLDSKQIKQIFGVVIGRVDLAGSMGLGRDAINTDQVLDQALEVAMQAKQHGLKVVIGGAITHAAWQFLANFPSGYIDYLDTRKITLKYPSNEEEFNFAVNAATKFELLWLANKQNYYRQLSIEDEARINLLAERL